MSVPTFDFQKNLTNYINAGFSGIWLHSYEYQNTLQEIAQVANERKTWSVFVWRPGSGLEFLAGFNPGLQVNSGEPDALMAAWPTWCEQMREAYAARGTVGDSPDERARRFHPILVIPGLQRPDMHGLRAMEAQLTRTLELGSVSTNPYTIVGLSYDPNVPPAYQRLFAPLAHRLPAAEEIDAQLRAEFPDEMELAGAGLDFTAMDVVNACKGLTRRELSNAVALSLFSNSDRLVDPSVIWDIKADALAKSSAIKVYRGTDNMDDIGGLSALKEFSKQLLDSKGPGDDMRARGLLLVGLPGTGKTQISKTLGNYVGRPVLMFDLSACRGGIIGESERNMDKALAVADAMEPCILVIDQLVARRGNVPVKNPFNCKNTRRGVSYRATCSQAGYAGRFND